MTTKTMLSLTLVVVAVLASATGAVAREIAPEALEQIAVLMEEKRARTPAQQKIDSRLLYELAARRGAKLFERVPQLKVARRAGAGGTVVLDLDAEVDDDLVGWIETLGGTVHGTFPRFGAVRASLPIERLEALASLPQVRSVRPADLYMTQMTNTSEGDVAHAADDARATFGVDGTGVKVGVMSDSVDALADLQASGDLPPGVTVLAGQSGNPGTSEGTALMEVVHDLAPGAELFFATGAGGQAQMAQNILDLQAAGCTVIVDDVLYFAEPVFQDGVIAQAVDEVAAAGVAYVSAAGNSGNLAAGTAGVWEGDFSPAALPGPLAAAGLSAHDFGGGANSNAITLDTPFFVTLQWSDPADASANDYDLYLLDPGLTAVLAASTATQNGSQDPFEVLDSTATDDTGNRLVVVKVSGEDRFLHLNTHRGQLAAATDGQIFGHPAAEGAIAVAAVNVATAGGGEFAGGAANPPEPFTSDGPRRIFFEADGTPVAATRDALTRGTPQPSQEREVPDVTGADGVSTATPGFETAFGTSFSAPNVAGIAALVKQILSSLSAEGMKQRLARDAKDIGDPGKDNVTGSGIPKADDAIEGKKGFQDDAYSVKTGLGTGSGDCATPQASGMGDNTVVFDGMTELLDPFTNGTAPFVFEFETDPDSAASNGSRGTGTDSFNAEIGIEAVGGDDLFPEGFEDPESGTPLSDACIEIGIDDTLDSDCPLDVTSAVIQFGSPTGPLTPIDVTSAFPGSPWNGRAVISVPNLAGLDIDSLVLKLTLQETPGAIFADGFETGNTASWTNQTP